MQYMYALMKNLLSHESYSLIIDEWIKSIFSIRWYQIVIDLMYLGDASRIGLQTQEIIVIRELGPGLQV